MGGASADQRRLVGISCPDYRSESLVSSVVSYMSKACDTCEHWDGAECTIDVFDEVLTGLDQT